MDTHVYNWIPDAETEPYAEGILGYIKDHFERVLAQRQEPIAATDRYLLFNEDFTAHLFGTPNMLTIQFIESPNLEYTEH